MKGSIHWFLAMSNFYFKIVLSMWKTISFLSWPTSTTYLWLQLIKWLWQCYRDRAIFLHAWEFTSACNTISKSIYPDKAFCLKPQLSHHLGRLWKYYSSIQIPIVMLISSNFAITFKFNWTISHSCFSTWVLKGWQSCRHPPTVAGCACPPTPVWASLLV